AIEKLFCFCRATLRKKSSILMLAKTMSLQTCITASTFKSSDSRKEFIEDFVVMCAEADIPLEKMTKLHPFLLKHCKQGGAIMAHVKCVVIPPPFT
uniref:Uncharacterized protein n=1 Tax=Acanthochromis polyacanthus TaxID=80966 RepID=A0A3Q1EWG6_9TELE